VVRSFRAKLGRGLCAHPDRSGSFSKRARKRLRCGTSQRNALDPHRLAKEQAEKTAPDAA
jgi:hypothetical protein